MKVLSVFFDRTFKFIDDMGKNKQEARERVQEFDKLLYEIEQDLEQQKKWANELKNTQKKIKKLSKYIQNNWLEDYDELSNEEGFHVLGQDYPYNALMDFKENQKELLKIIVKDL